MSGWIKKGWKKRKENLEAKLEKLEQDIKDRTDDVTDFRQMGIDHLFVDESHNFKNLMFNTRHARVSGLGNPEGSMKAMNMLFAIRTIQERTGRDLGATFLSGTTISNSLTELYLLFKYLRPKEMERQGITCFDGWAAVYAKKSTDFEFSVTNQVVQKNVSAILSKCGTRQFLCGDNRLQDSRGRRGLTDRTQRATVSYTTYSPSRRLSFKN